MGLPDEDCWRWQKLKQLRKMALVIRISKKKELGTQPGFKRIEPLPG
jgi:hypothetical protein